MLPLAPPAVLPVTEQREDPLAPVLPIEEAERAARDLRGLDIARQEPGLQACGQERRGNSEVGIPTSPP